MKRESVRKWLPNLTIDQVDGWSMEEREAFGQSLIGRHLTGQLYFWQSKDGDRESISIQIV